jgi:hypothetical protein
MRVDWTMVSVDTAETRARSSCPTPTQRTLPMRSKRYSSTHSGYGTRSRRPRSVADASTDVASRSEPNGSTDTIV